MLLKELLKAIQPVEVAGDSDIEITGYLYRLDRFQ